MRLISLGWMPHIKRYLTQISPGIPGSRCLIPRRSQAGIPQHKASTEMQTSSIAHNIPPPIKAAAALNNHNHFIQRSLMTRIFLL